MPALRKKKDPKKQLLAVERAAKRKAQKDQGALDGRFREKVVKSKKRYTRKQKPDPTDEG